MIGPLIIKGLIVILSAYNEMLSQGLVATMKITLNRFSVTTKEDGAPDGINARAALDFLGAQDSISGFIDIYFERPDAKTLTFEQAEKLVIEKVLSYVRA